MRSKSSSAEILHALAPVRRPELDALRGLFLVWMTLTHLPTRMSELVNTPFGYVTSADGFVLLSAMLVSQIYLRRAAGDPERLRASLWKRAFRLYQYHLFMLTVAFTVVAAIAVRHHRIALTNLLDFYLAHPVVAIIGSLLLIYCPPLLDILPMYVLFLLLTPFILYLALRRGWTPIVLSSFTIWVLAQFGLRVLVHDIIVKVTHLPIPLQQTGAFDLFSWQWLWVAGLWIGARSDEGENPLRHIRGGWVALCAVLCVFFVALRHQWLGPHVTPQAFGYSLDKWRIGPLRMVNLVACAGVLYWSRRYVKRIVSREPFLTLGAASMEVFCTHLLFVFVGLAMLYNEVPELHGIYALLLLIGTFIGLIFVASRQVRRKQKERGMRSARAAT
ncbi:OpgC domain-containing protein [Edaphobacter albus]|uniref:OpgC domain-containing protein n=1 Tax=Edaphobacter sp. 4G125 TaxID=2763071 RepID=UPI001648855C|nr:OpgC domain-containing protein [Edaphobacter sp. 4G125]QNI37300.1 OpgC domain-containing protein [Edaphobacter sp. 4G125]